MGNMCTFTSYHVIVFVPATEVSLSKLNIADAAVTQCSPLHILRIAMMCGQKTLAQNCRPQRTPSIVLIRAVAQVSGLDKHTAAIRTPKRRLCDIIRSVRIGGLEVGADKPTDVVTVQTPDHDPPEITPVRICVGGTWKKTGLSRKMLVTRRCANLVMTFSPRCSGSTLRVLWVPNFRFMPMEMLHWKCK